MSKYLVLQDLWLKDVCFKKGEVIGEPVSKRWIDLRLIKEIREPSDTLNVAKAIESIVTTDNESEIVAVTDAIAEGETELKRPRKYHKRNVESLEVD